jgi:hypothetical protein
MDLWMGIHSYETGVTVYAGQATSLHFYVFCMDDVLAYIHVSFQVETFYRKYKIKISVLQQQWIVICLFNKLWQYFSWKFCVMLLLLKNKLRNSQTLPSSANLLFHVK